MTTQSLVRKAIAELTPGDDAPDAFPGTFEIILSTATKDRDGEEVKSAEWELPLPEHITLDTDHSMTVAGTVGSGRPEIDSKGRLLVHGTYSSDAEAQRVRVKVNEGHIRFTSVAFLRRSRTDQKGVRTVQRELLNGAFVAVPANTDSRVLSSKMGARNNASDATNIQAIHDTTNALGAMCGKQLNRKDMMPPPAEDDPADVAEDASVATLATTIDDSLDQAMTLLATIDLTTLPTEVQQACALVEAADTAADALMALLGLYDAPDPEDQGVDDSTAPAAAKAAAANAVRVEAMRSRIQLLATKGTT